jgi:hypothetical protein
VGERTFQSAKVIDAADLGAGEYFDEVGTGFHRCYDFAGCQNSRHHDYSRLGRELDDVQIQAWAGNEVRARSQAGARSFSI